MTQIFIKKTLAISLTAGVFGAVALTTVPLLSSDAMANTFECGTVGGGSFVTLGQATSLTAGNPGWSRSIRIDRGNYTWMKTGLFTVTFSEGVTLVNPGTWQPINMPVSQANAGILSNAIQIDKFGPMEPSRCQGTIKGCWYQHNVTPISAQMVGGKTVVTFMIGKPGDRREAAEMEGMRFTFFLKSNNAGSINVSFADDSCNAAGLGNGSGLKGIDAGTVSGGGNGGNGGGAGIGTISVEVVGGPRNIVSGSTTQQAPEVRLVSTATIPNGSKFTVRLTNGATWINAPSCGVQNDNYALNSCIATVDPNDRTKAIITIYGDVPAGKLIMVGGSNGWINTVGIAPGTTIYAELASDPNDPNVRNNAIPGFGTHTRPVAYITPGSATVTVTVGTVPSTPSGASNQAIADVTVKSSGIIPAGSQFAVDLSGGATWDSLPNCNVQGVPSACTANIDPNNPQRVIITVHQDLPAGKEISLSGGKINTNNVVPGTDVTATLTSSGNNIIPGFGSHTVKVATVVKGEITVSTGTVPSTPSGSSSQSVADVSVWSTATIPSGSQFNVELTDGATWASQPGCSVLGVTSACEVSIDPSNPRRAVITVQKDLPAGKTILLNGGKINTVNVSPGTDVYMLLTSTGQNAIPYFGSYKVKVAAVGSTGDSDVKVIYRDRNTPGYDIVFAGRRDQQIWDLIELVESKPGSLAKDGTIVYTLSSGVIVKGGKLNITTTVLGGSCDPVTVDAGSDNASCRIVNESTGTPGTMKVWLDGNVLSLLGVDAGSLYATISGTATTNWTDSTVKVAEIVRASNTIPAGGVVNLQPGVRESQITDIIINESRPGALIQGRIVLAIDDGLYLNTVGTTSAEVFDANGKLLYSLPVIHSDRVAPGTLITDPTKRAVEFTLPQSSTEANGPYKIVVSRLFVEAMSDNTGTITSPEKYYSMTIGGDLTAATVADKLQSDTGAKPWSQSFEMVRVSRNIADKEGGAWLDISGAINMQGIYGNWTIGSAALGKPGNLYLMIRMPPITDDTGFVVTRDWTAWTASSKQWEIIADWTASGICEKMYPLYTTDSLQDIRNMLLVLPSTNMTAFRNTQVYMGYGVSMTGNNVEACYDMINSGTYWTAGIIQ